MQRTLVDMLNIARELETIVLGISQSNGTVIMRLACGAVLQLTLTPEDRDGLSKEGEKALRDVLRLHQETHDLHDHRLNEELIEEALREMFGSERSDVHVSNIDPVSAIQEALDKLQKLRAAQELANAQAKPDSQGDASGSEPTHQESLMGQYLMQLLVATGATDDELKHQGVAQTVQQAVKTIEGLKLDLANSQKELKIRDGMIIGIRKTVSESVNLLGGVI